MINVSLLDDVRVKSIKSRFCLQKKTILLGTRIIKMHLHKYSHLNMRLFAEKRKNMKKCVITVVGKDTVGIIAKVCTYFS